MNTALLGRGERGKKRSEKRKKKCPKIGYAPGEERKLSKRKPGELDSAPLGQALSKGGKREGEGILQRHHQTLKEGKKTRDVVPPPAKNSLSIKKKKKKGKSP